MSQTCTKCGGRLIIGQPLAELKIHSSSGTYSEFYCAVCMEDIYEAFWDPEDDAGRPRSTSMQWRTEVGRS